jgi:hypothetical protein
MRLVNPVNQLVLWEQDIDKIVSASFYKLSRAVVREYEGDKYLTLNKKSTIEKTTAKGPVTLLRLRETYEKRMKINAIIFIRTKIL